MPKNKNYKGRNPPKNKKDIKKKTEETSNEFCSFRSSSIISNYCSWFNILDYYDERQLRNMIAYPMENNQALRELSLILYSMNGSVTNSIDYMVSLPTLDKVVITHGNNKKKKNVNKELMLSILRKIKDKEIIRDALFRGMVEGISFHYFETATRPIDRKKFLNDFDVDSIVEINEANVNATIISLPADYTRIVGLKNSNYVIAFNLEYFNDGTGETAERKLKKYPKEIREAYRKWRDGLITGNWYVLDSDKTIVHKIKSKRDEPWGRPLALAAVKDILYSDSFVETKRGVLDEINNKVIYQTFPRGQQQGTSALTKSQQQQQHDAVKSAITNKGNRSGISFFSVAADTKIASIDTSNIAIFDSKNEEGLNDKIALDLGLSASLLNGVGSGTYSSQVLNLELITSQIMQWIAQIEAELNKCINKNIIKDKKNWVEVKYLPITHVNKKEMVSNCKELYTLGRGSLSLWASACGVSPDAFFALLDEEKENGIEKKYPPHQTSYTLSGRDRNSDDSNKGGRPMTDNPTDNTVKSRNNNGNDLPSPSDN